MDIVDRIKECCEIKGITIGQLEDKCNLPTKSIYKWNKNKPSVDRVVKVAEYLRVDVAYLLGTTNYKSKFEEWEATYNYDGQLKNKVKELEAADAIATQLQNKVITDDKLKALLAYMDLLFKDK